MAEFKKLSEVELLETASDNATVLVEEGGEIKRVAKSEVGGAGIKTAIIKSSDYDNTIAGLSTAATAVEITYACLNMTFEEAYQTMASGEPLQAVAMWVSDGAICGHMYCMFAGSAMFGEPCVILSDNILEPRLALFWTTSGLSTSVPNQDK